MKEKDFKGKIKKLVIKVLVIGVLVAMIFAMSNKYEVDKEVAELSKDVEAQLIMERLLSRQLFLIR